MQKMKLRLVRREVAEGERGGEVPARVSHRSLPLQGLIDHQNEYSGAKEDQRRYGKSRHILKHLA